LISKNEWDFKALVSYYKKKENIPGQPKPGPKDARSGSKDARSGSKDASPGSKDAGTRRSGSFSL